LHFDFKLNLKCNSITNFKSNQKNRCRTSQPTIKETREEFDYSSCTMITKYLKKNKSKSINIKKKSNFKFVV